MRRLESEAVRDWILAVSGKLDRTFGGPPVPVEPRPDGTFVVPEKGLPTPTSPWRRSLYLLARRNYHPDLLGAFDQPDLTTNCTRRASSAVVLQSLAMLNDRFVVDQAGFLAGRVAEAAGGPAPEREGAGRFRDHPRPAAHGRGIVLVPRQLGRHDDYYRGQGLPPDRAAHESLAHLCHMLLNTSEFLYIP